MHDKIYSIDSCCKNNLNANINFCVSNRTFYIIYASSSLNHFRVTCFPFISLHQCLCVAPIAFNDDIINAFYIFV